LRHDFFVGPVACLSICAIAYVFHYAPVRTRFLFFTSWLTKIIIKHYVTTCFWNNQPIVEGLLILTGQLWLDNWQPIT